jgi:hypothetical protein
LKHISEHRIVPFVLKKTDSTISLNSYSEDTRSFLAEDPTQKSTFVMEDLAIKNEDKTEDNKSEGNDQENHEEVLNESSDVKTEESPNMSD